DRGVASPRPGRRAPGIWTACSGLVIGIGPGCNSSGSYGVMLIRRAAAAASVRLVTPSLARMWEMCTLTVFSLMNRSWAMRRVREGEVLPMRGCLVPAVGAAAVLVVQPGPFGFGGGEFGLHDGHVGGRA